MTHTAELRLYNASVQKLQQVDHRAAWRSVARFDHADVSPTIVAKTEETSKTGLRKPGPLANGFERCWIHRNLLSSGSVKSRASHPKYPKFSSVWVSANRARCTIQRGGRLTLPFCLAGKFARRILKPVRPNISAKIVVIRIAARAFFESAAAFVVDRFDVELFFKIIKLKHHILPCPVEHRSVADELYIRNIVPVVNKEMSVA